MYCNLASAHLSRVGITSVGTDSSMSVSTGTTATESKLVAKQQQSGKCLLSLLLLLLSLSLSLSHAHTHSLTHSLTLIHSCGLCWIFCNFVVWPCVVKFFVVYLGVSTRFVTVAIDASSPLLWNNIKRPYWVLDYYHVPICRFEDAGTPLNQNHRESHAQHTLLSLEGTLLWSGADPNLRLIKPNHFSIGDRQFALESQLLSKGAVES